MSTTLIELEDNLRTKGVTRVTLKMNGRVWNLEVGVGRVVTRVSGSAIAECFRKYLDANAGDIL